MRRTLDPPDWSDQAHSLAFTALVLEERALVHVMINAYWEPLAFALPPRTEGPHQGWQRWVDTARDAPEDICAGPEFPPCRTPPTWCNPGRWCSWWPAWLVTR